MSIVVVVPCTSKLPTIIKLPPIFALLATCNSVVGVIPIPICVDEINKGVLLPNPSVILLAVLPIESLSSAFSKAS